MKDVCHEDKVDNCCLSATTPCRLTRWCCELEPQLADLVVKVFPCLFVRYAYATLSRMVNIEVTKEYHLACCLLQRLLGVSLFSYPWAGVS